MGGWKTKFIFLLIVYFAGFATAIYVLAPVPDAQDYQTCEKGFGGSAFQSGEFVQTFNIGMHKCVGFTKNAAISATRFVKRKIEQSRLQTDS